MKIYDLVDLCHIHGHTKAMGTHTVLFPALVPGTSDAYMPTKRKVEKRKQL